jgi:hypothetical protein
VTCRLRSPPYPAAAPVSTTARPSPSRPVRREPGRHHSDGAERRTLSGLAPPASTVLRIPLRGMRLRRAVDPGDLCQPSGPDSEGQARSARGEPRQANPGRAGRPARAGRRCGHRGRGGDHRARGRLGSRQAQGDCLEKVNCVVPQFVVHRHVARAFDLALPNRPVLRVKAARCARRGADTSVGLRPLGRPRPTRVGPMLSVRRGSVGLIRRQARTRKVPSSSTDDCPAPGRRL